MVRSFLKIPKRGCTSTAPLCRRIQSLTSHPVTFPSPVRSGFHAAGIGSIPWGISFKINLQILSANNILCVYKQTENSLNLSINVPLYLNEHAPSFTLCSNEYSFAVRSIKGSLCCKSTSGLHLWIYHHNRAAITCGHMSFFPPYILSESIAATVT